MQQEELKRLLEKHVQGTCSPEEEAKLAAYYNHLLRHHRGSAPEWDLDRFKSATFAEIQRKLKRPVRWKPIAAAAALLVASVVGYFAVDSHKSSGLPTGQAGNSLAATEILPGGNRATLTLADGRVVNLDEAQTGIVVGTESITYTDGSSLGAVMVSGVEPSLQNRRDPSHAQSLPRLVGGDASVMLALTTPKGGTYQVTLPDGSKVWLNSASTLKYPSRFSGDSREVVLEGEAYFDIVSMDRARITDARERSGSDTRASSPAGSRAFVMRAPFKVKTNGQTVEVLGTTFNISAYADETETKTTLVEGKVKVTPGTEKGSTQKGLPDFPAGRQGGLSDYVLTPGQQAITRARPDESGQALPGQEAATTINEVDVEQYTAWKDGYFKLDGTLKSVMAQVSRWYDVEVVFDDNVDVGRELMGEISRDKKLGDILRMINEIDTGLKFKVEAVGTANRERRLRVMR